MAATVTELESMIVRLTGDATGYQRMLQTAQRNTLVFNQTINSATSAATVGGGGAAASIGLMGGAMLGFGAIASSVTLAAQTEAVQAQFGTMLGSVERGSQMMRDLIQFAAETPLTLTDVQRATRQLLQFGVAGGDVIETMRMLGDVTGGDANRFNSMAYAFGQMRTAGRLMGQENLQMINAGFNPLQEISRQTGQSVAYLRDQMAKGRISVEMVRDAFRSATSAGGPFHQLMLTQSQTSVGLWSTMTDNVQMFMRAIGSDVIEIFRLKDAMRLVIQGAQDLTTWFTSLSPETRKYILLAGGLAVAILAAAVAWPVLASGIGMVGSMIASSFTTLIGAASFLLGPLGLALAAGAAVAWALIQNAGGIGAAWTKLRDVGVSVWAKVSTVVSDFLTWATPLWRAYVGYLESTWETFSWAAEVAFQIVRDLVDNLAAVALPLLIGSTGDLASTWTTLRDVVVGALITGEFYIRRFTSMFQVMTGFIAVGLSMSVDYLTHVFTELIPDVLTYVYNFWTSTFSQLWAVTETFLGNLTSNIVDVITNLPAILRGEMDFYDLWAPLMDGVPDFNPIADGVIRDFAPTVGTEQLIAETRAAANAVGDDFNAFFGRRMAEVNDPGEWVYGWWEDEGDVGYRAGQEAGQNYRRAATKELQKFDAVSIFSAEAQGRINDYMARIGGASGAALAQNMTPTPTGGPAGVGAPRQPAPVGGNAPVPQEPAALGAGDAAILTVLTAIAGSESASVELLRALLKTTEDKGKELPLVMPAEVA